MSRPTLKARMQRRLNSRTIEIMPVVDPLALGHKTRATIGINVLPHGIDAVARELACIKDVHQFEINTGHFALIVSTDFKGPEDLPKLMREDLGNIQGIVSHETMVCLKTTKDSFTPTLKAKE